MEGQPDNKDVDRKISNDKNQLLALGVHFNPVANEIFEETQTNRDVSKTGLKRNNQPLISANQRLVGQDQGQGVAGSRLYSRQGSEADAIIKPWPTSENPPMETCSRVHSSSGRKFGNDCLETPPGLKFDAGSFGDARNILAPSYFQSVIKKQFSELDVSLKVDDQTENSFETDSDVEGSSYALTDTSRISPPMKKPTCRSTPRDQSNTVIDEVINNTTKVHFELCDLRQQINQLWRVVMSLTFVVGVMALTLLTLWSYAHRLQCPEMVEGGRELFGGLSGRQDHDQIFQGDARAEIPPDINKENFPHRTDTPLNHRNKLRARNVTPLYVHSKAQITSLETQTTPTGALVTHTETQTASSEAQDHDGYSAGPKGGRGSFPFDKDLLSVNSMENKPQPENEEATTEKQRHVVTLAFFSPLSSSSPSSSSALSSLFSSSAQHFLKVKGSDPEVANVIRDVFREEIDSSENVEEDEADGDHYLDDISEDTANSWPSTDYTSEVPAERDLAKEANFSRIENETVADAYAYAKLKTSNNAPLALIRNVPVTYAQKSTSFLTRQAGDIFLSRHKREVKERNKSKRKTKEHKRKKKKTRRCIKQCKKQLKQWEKQGCPKGAEEEYVCLHKYGSRSDLYEGNFHDLFDFNRDFKDAQCIYVDRWPQAPTVCRDKYMTIEKPDTPIASFLPSNTVLGQRGDNVSRFNETTGQFRVKRPGLHLVQAMLHVEDENLTHWAAIFLNNKSVLACPQGGFKLSFNGDGDDNQRVCQMSGLLHLTTTSVLELRTMEANMEVALTPDKMPTFTIVRLAQLYRSN